MGLADHRSPAVSTGLSFVLDLDERLGPAALRITGATPKRTTSTSPPHHVGSTSLTNDGAGLSIGWSIFGEHSGMFSVAITLGSAYLLSWGQVRRPMRLELEKSTRIGGGNLRFDSQDQLVRIISVRWSV